MAIDSTLLTAVQTICNEIAIPAPTTVVNPSQQVAQLVAQCNRAGEILRATYNWPFLRQLFTVTPAIGDTTFIVQTPNYTCARMIPETQWDSGKFWKLVGPMTDAQWAQWKFGVLTKPIRKIWRMLDYQTVEFFPAYSSTDATVFSIYFMVNEWALNNGAPATKMTLDADTHGYRSRLLTVLAKRNFLEAKGLPYEDAAAEYTALLDATKGFARTSRILNLGNRSTARHFVDYSNTPDTGYGP